jgi:hypothetical protein
MAAIAGAANLAFIPSLLSFASSARRRPRLIVPAFSEYTASPKEPEGQTQ